MTATPDHLPIDRLLAHQEWVRKLAVRLVHSPDLADDVAQNVWLRVLRSAPPEQGKERAWLAEVARNEARQTYRSDSARRRRELQQRSPPLPDPRHVVERAEVARRLLAEVLLLPDHYRDILLYRFFEGLRPPELARRSGRPITTVRSEIQRALAALRRRLRKRWQTRDRPWQLALLPLLRWPADPLTAPGPTPNPGPTPAGRSGFGPLLLCAGTAALLLLAVVLADWGADPATGGPPADAAGLPSAATGERTRVRREADAQGGPIAASAPLAAPSDADAADTAPAAGPTLRIVAPDGELGSDVRVRLVALRAEGTGAPDIREARLDGATSVVRLFDAFPDPAIGELLVWVIDPRFAPARAHVARPGAGETEGDEIRLERGSRVRGTVTTTVGAPVRGARVEARETASELLAGRLIAWTETDPQGRYEFSVPAATHLELAVFPTEADPARRVAVTAEPGNAMEFSPRIEAGASLSGRVLSPAGVPYADAGVIVTSPRAGAEMRRRGGDWHTDGVDVWRHVIRGATDAHGRYALRGLPAGRYDVEARPRGSVPDVWETGRRVVTVPAEAADLTVAATPVMLRVVPTSGALTEAPALLVDGVTRESAVETERVGEALLLLKTGSTYEIAPSVDGFATPLRTVRVAASLEPVEFEATPLPTGYSAMLRVRMPQDRELLVEAAYVDGAPSRERRPARRVAADLFAVDGLPEGEQRLVVRAVDSWSDRTYRLQDAVASVVLPQSEGAVQEIALEPGGRLRFDVTNVITEHGAAACRVLRGDGTEVTVELSQRAPDRGTTGRGFLNREGPWDVYPALAPGRYSIAVTDRDGREVRGDVEIVAGRETRHTLAFPR